MKFDIKRLLQKKGRTTEDWMLQNEIDSVEKLSLWEGENSDFELSLEFRDEISAILKVRAKPVKKHTKKVDAEKVIDYPTEDLKQQEEEQEEIKTNETSEEQKL